MNRNKIIGIVLIVSALLILIYMWKSSSVEKMAGVSEGATVTYDKTKSIKQIGNDYKDLFKQQFSELKKEGYLPQFKGLKTLSFDSVEEPIWYLMEVKKRRYAGANRDFSNIEGYSLLKSIGLKTVYFDEQLSRTIFTTDPSDYSAVGNIDDVQSLEITFFYKFTVEPIDTMPPGRYINNGDGTYDFYISRSVRLVRKTQTDTTNTYNIDILNPSVIYAYNLEEPSRWKIEIDVSEEPTDESESPDENETTPTS